jgi:hypothetical protein
MMALSAGEKASRLISISILRQPSFGKGILSSLAIGANTSPGFGAAFASQEEQPIE